MEPPFTAETATRSISGIIEPGDQHQLSIDVEVDPVEVGIFDDFEAWLSVEPTDARAAVFGELREAEKTALDPRLFSLDPSIYFQTIENLNRVQLDIGRCRDAERCAFILDMIIGNLGQTTETWTVDVSLSRTERGGENRELIVPSFIVEVSSILRERGLWATTGPLPFEGEVGVPAAYAVSVSTSITDPELFDVFVNEPRDRLVTRTKQAVVGPRELLWSLSYYEPSNETLSSQASCNAAGCSLDVVAIFQPERQGDWWIPIVLPVPDAMTGLVRDNALTIDTRNVGVAVIDGEVDAGTAGTLQLELEAEAGTTEALIWWLVFPEQGPYSYPPIPTLSTSEGDPIDQYLWFPLRCTDRCRASVTMSWQAGPANQWEGQPLLHYGIVIGGMGDGVASAVPPSIRVVPGS